MSKKQFEAVRGKSKSESNPLAGKAKLPPGSTSAAKRMLLFSLKDLDETQGQKVSDWANTGLLEKLLNRLRDASRSTLAEAQNKSFKIYGTFPPTAKTEFFHPHHVGEDAQWASMHIMGGPCIAGHVVENIFYIVFLDEDHEFYKSPLKHT